jgi:23S rRNA pseudouridine1911/1915/1917 synthase
MADSARPLPERVLYIDDCMAVVYKKIGEVCESESADPSLSLVGNLRPCLEEYTGRKLPELEAVHRIDQPVSGCVLLAFERKTLAVLASQFATGKIRKKYLAIVERTAGREIPAEGRLEHVIRFDAKHHKALAMNRDEVRKPGPDWKNAALSWTLAGNGERYAFLIVVPETGRTHQIRAQLAAAGMTIKGDLKYGAKRSDPLGGIRLHSYAIQFPHPVTGDSLTIVAPVMNPDTLWQAFTGFLP